MQHLEVSQLFAMLAIMLGVAKIGGALARRVGQPAVLGELIAGVVVGQSGLNLVSANDETIQMLSELGVLILLLAIGLETNLPKLLRVGATSTAVAVVGIVLPFGLGYATCHLLGLSHLVAIMAAASLTATSVGITARVLSDLGRLHNVEGQIILGAAVLDDILGLVILTVVTDLARGHDVTVVHIASTTAIAFGFMLAVLLVGRFLNPWFWRAMNMIDLPGTPTIMALILALLFAWLADKADSALILGAFAAGLLLSASPRAEEIEHGITALGHFFVPLFFVGVGASVDLRTLSPLDPDGRWALLIGALLIVVGVIGKLLAGYAPFWFKGSKAVIGVGMIPRGEVGLIFAKKGLESGVFSEGLFTGVTLMVMVTTLMAPPLLKHLLTARPGKRPAKPAEGIDELVMNS
ncbi:MAG: cation:proton antiporter [Isosphaeraceae bacterium]